MKKMRFLIFFIVFSASQLHGQNFQKRDLIKDFDDYVSKIQKKHANPFNWISKDDFLKAADLLKKNADSFNTDQFLVGFLKINALLKDEHTNLDFHQKKYYPITFFWFEEGMTALSTLSDYSSILGARLIAIDDIPFDTIEKKCRELAAVNTSTGFKTKITSMLSNPVILHGLNITPTNEEVSYTFIKSNSDTVKIKIQSADQSIGGFQVLLPEKQLLRNSNRNLYWYKFDEEKKYLYINYNQCAEMQTFPFNDFLNSFKSTVESKNPDKIIIDLRYNGGGSYSIFKPLIVYIANTPVLKGKKIYTLIGRRTFSAAVINAYQLSTTAHALMVGEETGGKLNHAGAVQSFVLKNTGITVYYSYRDLYFDATQKGGIVPEISTKNTLGDYMEGIDAALDAAIEN